MPDLPTLTVTQEQANRMIAAWGSPGEPLDVIISRYKNWLANQIIAYVTEREQQIALQEFMDYRQAQKEAAREELMPAEIAPPDPPV